MLAREFGATDIVAERGDEGVARIKDLTRGVGADAVLECVGTQESMMHAIHSTRPGGSVGYVGVPHGVELDVLPHERVVERRTAPDHYGRRSCISHRSPTRRDVRHTDVDLEGPMRKHR